jgi:hypothetical protein
MIEQPTRGVRLEIALAAGVLIAIIAALYVAAAASNGPSLGLARGERVARSSEARLRCSGKEALEGRLYLTERFLYWRPGPIARKSGAAEADFPIATIERPETTKVGLPGVSALRFRASGYDYEFLMPPGMWDTEAAEWVDWIEACKRGLDPRRTPFWSLRSRD